MPPQAAATLASALLATTEHAIIPLTAKQVAQGSKLFGAAILERASLRTVLAETNNERESPLLHGEINCIQQFFKLPRDTRPETKECIFFATHEPCSLCLSGITWSGFNEFYYMFTYEDSRDLFAIPYDIDILKSVYQVASPGESEATLAAKPLYNRRNKFFTARSLAELIDEVDNEATKTKLKGELHRIKQMYHGLSATYQEGKQSGAESSSIFK
ncbi:putative cytidine deoxycytidylate deaminase family protein [Cladophialophora carrionii]|uniref:Putative cytidine deoxycytidylate deaminase family protein n=1 Tax=Cladophialophora carrionii TaxID=86049 RepID=A0A1C1CZ24_9EURO|nr:putative cytidine deoxycytidylate deaminase family protein [Cladophialophora carrionii]